MTKHSHRDSRGRFAKPNWPQFHTCFVDRRLLKFLRAYLLAENASRNSRVIAHRIKQIDEALAA